MVKYLTIFASLYVCSTSVIEESFHYLDAPVGRITGADVPVPYNAGLERMSLPQVCVAGFSLFCMMIFICTCNIGIYESYEFEFDVIFTCMWSYFEDLEPLLWLSNYLKCLI